MTLNDDLCHLLVFGHKQEQMFASSSFETTSEKISVKLIEILVDSYLTVIYHLKVICKKASQKLTAISRFFRILKTIIEYVFGYQLYYCQLIWIF